MSLLAVSQASAAEYQVFRNDVLGCEVLAPADWVIVEKDGRTLLASPDKRVYLFFKRKQLEEKEARVKGYFLDYLDKNDEEIFLTSLKNSLDKRLSDVAISEAKFIKTDDNHRRIEIIIHSKSVDQRSMLFHMIAKDEDEISTHIFFQTRADFNKYLPEVEKILKTWKVD